MEFWGSSWNPKIVDDLGAPDILLQYLLQAPRHGRADVRTFMTDFREAFPDLSVTAAADFVCEGDYVVGRWKGSGTHTPAPPTVTSLSVAFRQVLAGRCGSQERPFFVSKTARSHNRSVSTMG
jgi:SnoaL-like polyketide cyclase